MKVPLLDLKKQYDSIRDEIVPAALEVFESQRFSFGPKVEEFERAMAEYCGSGYAVGVSSGSDALLMSLMVAGIGRGDLVITTPYTFFATAGAIARVGADPVFVDIDERTYNIDPRKLKEYVSDLSAEKRSKIKAIIPVHLYGQCADMEPILEIAGELGPDVKVIEDAAQAIGAEYRFSDGKIKKAGTMGDYGCFSFYPTKNLGAFGEGGLVTCNDKDLYDQLKTFRNHGDTSRYVHEYVGGNFRLESLQAAILTIKLKYLDKWTDKRIYNAASYKTLFEEKTVDDIALPYKKEERHIYHQYVINAGEQRDSLKEYLLENGVGCEVYYPVPLHEQKCFSYLGYKSGDFPVSEKASKISLAIPVFPELTKDEQVYIVDIISNFFK
ncbi:MAG: DegT/DnrJ/EryC1/StrS family aminotransferase [Desulfobacteraceae bacterium]